MSRRCDRFEPLLSAWVDGELNRGGRARVGAHLQRCARCRGQVHALRVTQAMLRSLPTRRLSPSLPLGPVAARHPAHGNRAGRVAVRASAVAVALAATLAAAGFMAGSRPPEPRRVAIPVDLYVADHLVRAVGGAVSTPGLTQPGAATGGGRVREERR